MSVIYTTKQPIRFIDGTGFDTTPNTDIFGNEVTTVTLQ